MSENYNAALRVHRLLSRTIEQPNNMSIIEVWAKTFSIDYDGSTEKSLLITEMVRLLYHELLTILTKLHELGKPVGRYEPAIKKMAMALNVNVLNNHWDAYKEYVYGNNMGILYALVDVLDNEGDELNEETLAEIVQGLDDITSFTITSDMSGSAKHFITSQLTILYHAIRTYPIVGGKAFTRGASAAAAEGLEQQSVINKATAEYDFRQALEGVKEIWKSITKHNTDVELLLTFDQEGNFLFRTSGKALDVRKLLTDSSPKALPGS